MSASLVTSLTLKAAIVFFKETKNWIAEKNAKKIEKYIKEISLFEKLEEIYLKDNNSGYEISAKIAQYFFTVYLDPALSKKKEIFKYDCKEILNNLEHISFYNSITSKDLEILKSIKESINSLEKVQIPQLYNMVEGIIEDQDWENFAFKLGKEFEGIFNLNSFLHEKYIFNFDEIDGIEIKYRPLENHNKFINEESYQKVKITRKAVLKDLGKIKFDFKLDTLEILFNGQYLNWDLDDELEETLERLNICGLISRTTYGATFGPSRPEYLRLTKKAISFLEKL
ncbi:hypothetical protein MENTO_v1c04460 [Mesoplasma entomophilum]|uniref:Uncharacterized protein n=1 Tax=Mesoplasma entomophilum TaxID=2149 RepID=A0A3S5XZ66_9MOLU|nr:hypothetical protein [Mesoplasma entomophilum]ATQ35584.1 hypothetical protein CS528_02315 [Mesoplasma entomophilum]ATZ19551.1 hypothetical protein MENTO_v1c04460 [Mesoplasma entomophilum]